jgi:hypothetical protein
MTSFGLGSQKLRRIEARTRIDVTCALYFFTWEPSAFGLRCCLATLRNASFRGLFPVLNPFPQSDYPHSAYLTTNGKALLQPADKQSK